MVSAPSKPHKSPYITRLATFPSQNSPIDSAEEAYVLSGDCDDELLQSLQVASVVPAPNSSQLLVTVYPVVASAEAFDAAEVRRRLSEIAGRLRSEVARSITRKKAPKLLFQLVQLV